MARQAGVSPATVSNVLGGRKKVRPDAAERVRAAVASLGYEADRAASYLRSGRSRVVAVLVPNLGNPFFTSIIASIERSVHPEGYDIIVAGSDDDEAIERKRLLALLSWRPAGLIILPCTDAFRSREVLDLSSCPYVVVDRVPEGLGADAATVDNQHAAGLAASHLLELGHTEILVVASTLARANIRERCDGVREIFRRSLLPEPPVLEAGDTFEVVSERLTGWLDKHGRPTGLIALTNFTTLGVMACLRRHKVRIPRDVSLVGFDDYPWMSVTTPSITAVSQPVELLGEQGWARLRSRIGGDPSPAARLQLRCALKVRTSTQRAGTTRQLQPYAKQE